MCKFWYNLFRKNKSSVTTEDNPMKKFLIVGHLGYIGPIVTYQLKKKYYICGVDTHWFKTKVNKNLLRSLQLVNKYSRLINI